MDYRIFYVIALTLAVTLHLQKNPEATIGDNCEDTNCTQSTETCNVDNECECSSDSFQSGNECLPKAVHGGGCIDDNTCQGGLKCYNTKCGCPDNNFYDGSACVSNSALVPNITEATSTFNNLTVTWTRIDDSNGYTSTYEMKYNNDSMTIGGNTSPQTTQSPPGLESNKVYAVVIIRHISYNGVAQDVLESPPQSIKTKSSHNEACTSNEDCAKFSPKNLICYHGGGQGSVCLCPDGYYYKQNLLCSTISELQPEITGNPTTYNSFMIEWTPNNAPTEYSSRYTLEYGSGSGSTVNINETSPIPIPNLSPNTPYQVTITYYFSIGEREQSISSDNKTVTTSKSAHGQSCSQTSQCDDGLKCYTDKCGCVNGTYYDSSSCVQNSALVPNITAATSAYNMFTVTWTRVDDSNGYMSTYDMKYNNDLVDNITGITSPQTTQSPPGLESNKVYDVVIKRHISYNGVAQDVLESPPKSIKTKSSHNQACSITEDCAKFSPSNLICYPGGGQGSVCLCPDDYYYKGNQLCSQISELKPEMTGNPTTYNSFMIEWTPNNAPTEYSSRYTLEYTPGSIVNIGEMSPTQPIQNLSPNTPYQVVITYYFSIRGREQSISSVPKTVTTAKSGHREPCSTNNSCMDGLKCYTQRSVCVCPDGRYYNQDNLACVEISDLIPAFSLSSDRTNIHVNLDHIPDAGTLYTSTFEAQLNPGNRNSSFTSNSASFDALTEGTMYDVTVTCTLTLKGVGRVQTTNPSQPQNISTKVSYNNTCSRNGICIDDYTDCYNERCLCNPKYYWRVGNCRDINELAPESIQAEVLDTTRVKVTWQLSSHSSFVSAYRVDATPTSTSDPDPSAVNVTGGGATTTTLTGQQPGTQFRFTVESMSTNDGRVEYVSGNPEYNVTNPAKITGLDETNSNISAPVMKIAFKPAVPKFSGYTVTLSGDGGYHEAKTASPSGGTDNYYYAEFNNVVSGKYYNIEVVTISEQDSRSEPFTDRRRAMVAQASEVMDLRNGTVTPRSVIINWKRPEKPNGNLFQYSLEISLNKTCQSRIIFDCRECPRNFSQLNDTAPSCKNVTTVTITKAEIDNGSHIVQHNVTSLDPDTDYDIQAVAYNEEGRGKLSNPLQVHTYSEPAKTPKSVKAPGLTSHSVTLTWVPETPRPGNTSYVVHIYERNEDKDQFRLLRTKTVLGYNTNSLDVQTLSSYWEYKFSVLSQSEVPPASGSVQTNVITTLESAPMQVVDLEAKTQPDVYDKIQLSWECPPQKDGRNGVILNATVKFETDTQRDGVTPKTGEKTFHKEQNSCSWDVALDVTAEFNYTFTVFISNSFAGATKVLSRYMPPGPAVIREDSVSKQQKGVSEKENSFPFAICPKCLRDGRNGLVESSGILVCKNQCPTTQKKRETITKAHYEQVDNWQKASAANFNNLYRATPSTWLPLTDQDSWVYEIGQNSSCDKSDKNGFCNGPLPEGSTYLVKVFVCTAAGCDESEPVSIKTKESPSSTNVIVGAVCGVLAAIAIVIAVIVFLKWRNRRKNGDDPSETPTPANEENELIRRKRPITLSDFPKKVEVMHRDSNLLFSEEFEDITAISPKHNAVASETGSNKLKNRYVNILPFDHSRVKLLQLEDEDEETDYLNANYIPGYRSVREYIATQGPMTGTINDFWRMIWEQKVPIIVMLSDLQEKGRPKVDRYYPENMEPVNYGDIRVEMTNFSPLSKYVIRIFKIEMGEEIRTVRHYFLPGWQDFGANLTSDNVIDFIKSVRMEIKPNNTGPLCIHCSAGVGRTGTYITLDVFQQHIDEEVMDKELDIFDFVMKMRQNRSHMVQTEKQYIFIHDTLMEMVIRKKKEMAERDTNVYMNTGTDDDLYVNQAFETDPNDIYMNVDTRTGNPTTVL